MKERTEKNAAQADHRPRNHAKLIEPHSGKNVDRMDHNQGCEEAQNLNDLFWQKVIHDKLKQKTRSSEKHTP